MENRKRRRRQKNEKIGNAAMKETKMASRSYSEEGMQTAKQI